MEAKIQCRECGAALQADSPSGFCASCLISLSLEEFARNKGDSPPGELELREAERAGLLPATPASVYADIKSQDNPFTPPSRTEKPGDRIGRYRLLQELGYGGCGIVYMAEQEEPVRRKVAIKVIKLGMDTRQVVARFEAERQALAIMDHPNIAVVLDAGATETGRPFFVMELVGGMKITDYCKRQNLSTHQRLKLFIQVCHAIQHAHQKGIIHRDIKPSNVLVVTQDGHAIPKVIDFGIAKATQGRLTDSTLFTAFDQFMGTPAYMSPEQTELGGMDVDTRSDIYSLGVLLYEILTGRTPAEKKDLSPSSIEELRRTIREKEPMRPSNRLSALDVTELTSMAAQHQSDPTTLIASMRGDLDWIVMKCLEKDRSRRYETADGLAQDIEKYLRNETVSARPPSRLYALQKLYRRNRLLVTASLAIAGVTLLGTAGIFWQWRRAEKHADLELNHRRRAEDATAQAQSALRQMEAIEIRRAEETYSQGNRRDMLPYLALVLRQNPSNSTAAERVFSTLSHRHWARLACPPLSHSNRVTSATFSRDGRLIVTSSADNTAWVWDANTGKPVCGPLRHEAEINYAEFSSDSQFVVTASDDHCARVWDAHSGIPVTGRLEHPERIELARFTPDGQFVVTLCDDRCGRIWNAKTGKLVLAPLRHGSGPPAMRFFKEMDISRNGELLVTAAKEDGIVRVWRLKTGEVVHKFPQPGDQVTCVRFSPDGSLLAVASSSPISTIWNLASNSPTSITFSNQGPVDSIEFSPEGKRVVTATRANTAQVWNAITGTQIGPRLRHNDAIRSAMFSPEGLRVVTASMDHTIRVWDAERGEPMTEPIRLEKGAYYAEFHRDGQRVITVSAGNSAHVWWIPSTVSLLFPGQHVFNAAEFSPDGTRLVGCGENGLVQIIDPRSLTGAIELPGLRGNVTCATFTKDGKYVAAAATDGFARVWMAHNGQPVGKPFKIHKSGIETRVLHLTPDGKRLFAISANGPQFWDIATGAAAQRFNGSAGYVTSDLSPDGKLVAIAGTNNIIQILDSDSGKPISDVVRHADLVLSLQFSPDSTRLLTSAADGSVRVWKVPTGELVTEIKGTLETLATSFSPNGSKFLTITPEKPPVRVWDATNAKLPVELSADNTRLAVFSPDGSRIVAGSQSGSSQLFDAQTGERLSESLPLRAAIRSIQINPDGKLIAWVSTEGNLRFYDAPSPALPIPAWFPELAETLVGQHFNQQGQLEPVSPNDLWEVQAKMSRSSETKAGLITRNEAPNEGWVSWAKWFLMPPSSRTVLPASTIQISKYAEMLSAGPAPYELAREALVLEPTNLTCLMNCALTATDPVIAEWLSECACFGAPPNSPAGRTAQDVRKHVMQRSPKKTGDL